MRNILIIILLLFLFSCGEQKQNPTTALFKECECEKTIKTDSIFYATNLVLKKETKAHSIVFKCAEIETAIASVSDLHGGNERCKNLYDINCTSNTNQELPLRKDFSYFSEDIQNMKLTKEAAQHHFFDELNSEKIKYYEFNLNTAREITAVTKLTTD